jgi:hypothetical protein
LAAGVPDAFEDEAEGEAAWREASWLGLVGDSDPDQTIMPTR